VAPPSDEDLLTAAEVAELLGLAHRNSVSTYRRRYPDFPQGCTVPGYGRRRVWPRGEILAWRDRFRAARGSADQPDPRLEQLVAATQRLMLGNPGVDLSVRQIAAEAGVPHSDVYRHASGKEQLQVLAVDRISAMFAADMPEDYPALLDAIVPLLARTRLLREPVRVMAHQLITDPDRPPTHPVAIAAIAPVLARHRATLGIESEVDPRVVAAAIGALTWGLLVFESRWLAAVGLDAIPDDQVARLVRAMLEA
jgi:glutathione-regulated potassium-efflux system ancillary protein KefG